MAHRAYTLQRVNVAPGSSAVDFVVVAATVNKRIRVLGFSVSCTTNTLWQLNSKGSGAGTAISPLFNALASALVVAPITEYGYYETNVGEGLTISTAPGGGVAMTVYYVVE